MPQVFISYSHQPAENLDRVLALSNRLRASGVDCIIDQYEQSPAKGWPQWCDDQVAESTYVLVLCNQTYLRRFKGEEILGVGKGTAWEGHIITQELYNAQGHNTKFIPITFAREDAGFIPRPLESATCYHLDEAYEKLYRRLTDQPAIIKPALGAVQPMPAREPVVPQPVLERKQTFQTIWTIPYARNPFFTGREQILSDLHQALTSRNCAALSGFGGLGKTQTAIEYAYRHRSSYQAVFWLKAETRDTLLSDFAAIAAALGLPEAAAQQQQLAVAAAKRWLEANDGWLLILDNADDLALAKEFLPTHHAGHVLLTTGARALAGIAEGVPLRVMSPDDAAQLLLRRAGIAHATPADSEIALQIAEELGYLPLALDQAGAFIEETPSSLAEYLQRYRTRRDKLLAERGSLADHASVTVTFSLAFDKVAQSSPAAADLLRLCAFLAPEAIPEEIVNAGADDFTAVLKQATRFSLLDRDVTSKTLDIHRLVQAVIQARMSASEQQSWAKRAVRAVNEVFPFPEFRNWDLCQKLLPHAQICAALIGNYNFEFSEASRLLSETAFYLRDRALYAEAEPLQQRALATREKSLGPSHSGVASSLSNLADLYRNQGKYAEAVPLCQRALAIDEKVYGPNHPEVATHLNNLGLLYFTQCKYVETEPLYQRAHAIREKALGPDHPRVATSLNNLAALYSRQGKYTEAEPLYQRALDIRERALGPDHPHVGESLHNLAALQANQGKYAEAEPLYRRALAIDEQAYGSNHPEVATDLNSLAELCRNQGQYAEAEPLYQRALAIREKALGPNHPDVATSLNNLAGLYYNQGQYAEAEPLYQRDLAICEKALGPNHPDVATSLNNLAELYRVQGQYAEAEPLYQRALAIREKALGPNHPDVATSLNNLAGLYYNQGQYAEAEPLYQRALASREKALGPNHPDVAQSLNNLAGLYDNQGQYAGAEPLYQRALAICEKALGPNHPNTATVRNNLAQNRAARLNTP
jgi:tetratricopeptide (TPR) repeat protein